jgi:hypothetical protein
MAREERARRGAAHDRYSNGAGEAICVRANCVDSGRGPDWAGLSPPRGTNMQPGDAARMRNIAVSSFFRAAFEQDMYPAEDMEGCFGVHMDDGVGAVVFNSWKTLFFASTHNPRPTYIR